MKIEKQGTVQFKDVKVGQVFAFCGMTSIKVFDAAQAELILVDLSNGYVNTVPSDDAEVTLCKNAKVVIE